MRKIRIAFLIDTIEHHFGGTETQLVRLLERLDRERFEPWLCVLKDSAWMRENESLCPTFIVGFRSFYSPASWVRMLRFAAFLRRNRIDILQSHFRDSNIVGTIAAKLAGVRTLVATRRNQGYWHNRIELALLHLLNPLASFFLVNSKAIQRYIESAERVPGEKIEVIYNGVDLEAFRRNAETVRRDLRSALGIEDTSTVVILIGNLRPVKGIDVFLECLARLGARHSGVRFLIVGEGPERARLQARIEALGLRDAVRLLGNRTDVPQLLMASDIAVNSSHSEGLSNAIIEYMAAGLPVVCTDVGGSSELVGNEFNGYVVPAGDSEAMATALGRLLENREQAREFGRRGRNRAQELFDISACVGRSQQLYERLFNERTGTNCATRRSEQSTPSN
jgi:glycosyltransferase involved in cell wall biosynthesis